MLLLIWYKWNHLVRSKSERKGLRKNEGRADSFKGRSRAFGSTIRCRLRSRCRSFSTLYSTTERILAWLIYIFEPSRIIWAVEKMKSAVR